MTDIFTAYEAIAEEYERVLEAQDEARAQAAAHARDVELRLLDYLYTSSLPACACQRPADVLISGKAVCAKCAMDRMYPEAVA